MVALPYTPGSAVRVNRKLCIALAGGVGVTVVVLVAVAAPVPPLPPPPHPLSANAPARAARAVRASDVGWDGARVFINGNICLRMQVSSDRYWPVLSLPSWGRPADGA